MENTKGIIFNRVFQELGMKKLSDFSSETILEAIVGLGAMGNLIGPILRKHNFKNMGNY